MSPSVCSNRRSAMLVVTALVALSVGGCSSEPTVVPRQDRWGIYALDLATERVELVYSSSRQISNIDFAVATNRIAFSLKEGTAVIDTSSEIYSIAADGTDLQRLTDNDHFDVYPSFSPDGSQIAFLSQRNGTLDLYVMHADGSGQRRLFGSQGHDSDVSWGNTEHVLFTCNHQIWRVSPDGTGPRQITAPPDAGQWGSANLPVGDYDPRLNPDGVRIVFGRLEDPNVPHGGYNLYVVSIDGTEKRRLTDSGYAQGMAGWSHSGDRIVYVVAAIEGRGQFHIYMMNADGTDNRNITPKHFPANFLVHQAVFSGDDAGVFFVGEWWE